MGKILYDPHHDKHVIVSSRASPRCTNGLVMHEASLKIQRLEGMIARRKAMQDFNFVHQE